MAVNYIDQLAEAVRHAIPLDSRPSERANDLYRLYALLVLITGTATTLENVHDAWSVWMNGQEPDHPSLRPFGQLDAETQREDRPFLDAILAVAAQRPAS